MHKLHRKTIETLARFQRQAARLAFKNPAHARLALYLAGYIKLGGA